MPPPDHPGGKAAKSAVAADGQPAAKKPASSAVKVLSILKADANHQQTVPTAKGSGESGQAKAKSKAAVPEETPAAARPRRQTRKVVEDPKAETGPETK